MNDTLASKEIMQFIRYALGACVLVASGTNASQPAPLVGKQIERLDRGAVAMKTPAGAQFIGWRALATDPAGTRFNVYRNNKKLNAAPLDVTNFTDSTGTGQDRYYVRAVVNGREQKAEGGISPAAVQWKLIPLQKPEGGTTSAGLEFTYEVGDGAPVDLDGDGSYEIVFRWQPTNWKDPSQSGYTGNTYLDAYRLDGTRLWRIDLGKNIRSNSHYVPFVAYDLDGDGRGEVMMRTADGTRDGLGRVIGSETADHRNADGRILAGPEYLTVFDGLTGAAMQSVDFIPVRGDVSSWGDSYGNRVDRFLAGVANLDGHRPSAVFSRGYYTRAVIAAWDWREGRLTRRWVFDTQVAGKAAEHQGAHSFAVADVDNDGKDDIVYGAATIASDGTLMYSTGLCHGDALHVGRFDPGRRGQQVYMVHETPACYGNKGAEMHDAATGAIFWSVDGMGKDVGRGTCMDVDPSHAGAECWATAGGLRSATGMQISAIRPQRVNFGVWWDGDLLRESLDADKVEKWSPARNALDRLLTGATYGAYGINGTKATPVVSADLYGDWREEIVWRSLNHDALMIFSTTDPTDVRMPTLMHDPQYRAQVAGQNMGYNQPPHPSFYLGYGMSPVVQAPVHVPARAATRD
ncbi:rhamnogalacturonan lyase [Massilia alkalitolerans]|uniref:rhamnogalacturonan lyase n=1 Tax=Massilia alkalitolerans TaxID=286638 RepID=UPI0004188787|nr:rhamnogalacturonan lyase [Massilia alkalitolerans]